MMPVMGVTWVMPPREPVRPMRDLTVASLGLVLSAWMGRGEGGLKRGKRSRAEEQAHGAFCTGCWNGRILGRETGRWFSPWFDLENGDWGCKRIRDSFGEAVPLKMGHDLCELWGI